MTFFAILRVNIQVGKNKETSLLFTPIPRFSSLFLSPILFFSFPLTRFYFPPSLPSKFFPVFFYLAIFDFRLPQVGGGIVVARIYILAIYVGGRFKGKKHDNRKNI